MKTWDEVGKLGNEVMVAMHSEAALRYDRLDFRLKAQICLEFLGSQERFCLFEEWRDLLKEFRRIDWLEDAVFYCESQDDGFWTWVSK